MSARQDNLSFRVNRLRDPLEEVVQETTTKRSPSLKEWQELYAKAMAESEDGVVRCKMCVRSSCSSLVLLARALSSCPARCSRPLSRVHARMRAPEVPRMLSQK